MRIPPPRPPALLILALALLVPFRSAAQMEAVDLGLSVKWASCNLGASKPKDAGKFYAWGETKAKTVFSENNYSLYKPGPGIDGRLNAREYLLTKYCSDVATIGQAPGVYGDVDGKLVLEPEDDPARKALGGKWRVPTVAERDELVSKCNWRWTKEGGVPGYRVTSKKNGNSIFLPAAGYYRDAFHYRSGEMGFYWAASVNPKKPIEACYLGFSEEKIVPGIDENYKLGEPVYTWLRHFGFSIRPVQ